MPLLNQLQAEYGRLNDPKYLKELIARNQMLYQPQLQESFASLDADLNRRGLYSASPVTRSRYRATSQFNQGIAQMTQSEVTDRWKTILPLLAQLELAEKEGRRQDRAGLLKMIGTILGTGAGFLIGGPPGALAGAGIGGSFSNMSAPSMQVNSPYYPR